MGVTLNSADILFVFQGLAVHCLVSVVADTDGSYNSSSSDNDRHYSCSLSTFSAPGNGMAVIPPVSAPLVIVKPDDGVSRGISLGCHLDASVGADPAASGGAGTEPGVDDGAGASPRSFRDRLRGWLQQHRGPAPSTLASNRARTSSDSGGGRYSGTIMVVLRGECTFEHKVGEEATRRASLLLFVFGLVDDAGCSCSS